MAMLVPERGYKFHTANQDGLTLALSVRPLKGLGVVLPVVSSPDKQVILLDYVY